jgi:hypothetical protein
VHERIHQDPITAYFVSASRKVSAFACPDFDEMLWVYHLRTRNVSFVADLPQYIIPMGRRIMVDTTYSNDATPNQLWLPDSPLISFLLQGTQALMGHRSSRPPSTLPSQRLDPNGINPASNPPFLATPLAQPSSSFPMGGGSTHSFGALSPLTTSDTLAIWGNPSPPVTGSSSMRSSKLSLISSIMGMVLPASSDSVSSNSNPTPLPAPPPNPFPPAIIKDKPSNIYLKDIVDKDFWLDAKKVIDA